MIDFVCAHCRRTTPFADDSAGLLVRCPYCGLPGQAPGGFLSNFMQEAEGIPLAAPVEEPPPPPPVVPDAQLGPLPDAVRALGPIRALFTPASSAVSGSLAVAIILANIGIGGLFPVAEYLITGKASVEKALLPIVGGFGLIGLVVGLRFLLRYLWLHNLHILITDSALAVVRGTKAQVVRWDEFAEVDYVITRHYTNGAYTGDTHKITAWKKNGGKLVFDESIQNVQQLAVILKSETNRAGGRLSAGPGAC